MNKAEVQNTTKILTLANIDQAEPRHPEKEGIQQPQQQHTLLVDHSSSRDAPPEESKCLRK